MAREIHGHCGKDSGVCFAAKLYGCTTGITKTGSCGNMNSRTCASVMKHIKHWAATVLLTALRKRCAAGRLYKEEDDD